MDIIFLKNKNRMLKREEKGSALILALGVAFLLGIFGVILVNPANRLSEQITFKEKRLQAMYLAESGLEVGLQNLREKGKNYNKSFNENFPKEGVYSYQIKELRNDIYEITGVGRITDVVSTPVVERIKVTVKLGKKDSRNIHQIEFLSWDRKVK